MSHPRSVAGAYAAIIVSALLLALAAGCGRSEQTSGEAIRSAPPASQQPINGPDVVTPVAQHASTPADTTEPVPALPAASPAAPTVVSLNMLSGTKWLLVSYGSASNQTPALPNAPATLDFVAEGILRGVTGCNEYHATYPLNSPTFTIEAVQQTERACTDQAARQQEAAFIAALRSAAALTIEGNTLIISYDQGELRFVLPPPPAASALAGTRWQLVAFETNVTATSVLTGAQVTAEFQSQQMQGRSGCNEYRATAMFDGQNLMLTDVFQTAMACDNQAVMQQEAAFIEALESTRSFQVEGDTLIIRYDGGALRFRWMPPQLDQDSNSPSTPTAASVPTAVSQ